ncbi:rhodanese-related sulfurtransferase [Arthrobacter sp. zg-Y40]|uniref:oxygen-dependent tRNA uridine(34) hydroxylase TrhO n=1 Tax=unclassified Arthrobacter TaxID=235627 RepID=UPI001D13FBDB|nr:MULTISPECIES: rhodanese-related sulfurtransferase [unclassified Arthrobacter]MCC3278141.1 rhodanese-related sulfurtransferase [Arthrobacter sp. zg-Y40]MCC3275879.1 rhodanese-related sulfurtransferase [Arthrobacter sp. zg-Y20]MDK1316036.1 rhodanese-related sulfurtransferase [Arthrobacter sp. zg.Y20]MDK1326762.1 rhodanese-related sulfurtransferase [Arthrobacter sp. zg-Y1143]WIB05671.1 rhodanese-related sulfurtransferase [Arthrobacter sp. zg-Y20]
MALNRIALYYAFTPLSDPDAVRLWQRTLCEKLGLRGRILISRDGINGTVGGDLDAVKAYVKATREYPAFKKMDVKYSEGSAEDFPRLSVKVRDEIVSFGAPGELKVDENGVVGGGTHLRPEELHELVEQKEKAGEEVVFFDGRNAFEAQIGKFKGAVVPDVSTTHDFISELESGKYDDLKDKPVVTYCTGGIRCEVLSSLMVNRGFKEVYQMKGGIVRYGETYGDKGLWEGSLYVFDKRMHTEFTDDAVTIGRCVRCEAPTSKFENCSNPSCRKLTLYCADCASDPSTLRCPDGCGE